MLPPAIEARVPTVPETYSCIHLHLVFSTKDRRRLIAPGLESRLHAYMAGIVDNLGAKAIAIGGTEDHVHLLVRWDTRAASDLMREVKGGSSRFVNSELPEFAPFYWQSGGGVFSVSKSDTERVAAYIRNQKEHHRRRSFAEEFEALMRKHGISM